MADDSTAPGTYAALNSKLASQRTPSWREVFSTLGNCLFAGLSMALFTVFIKVLEAARRASVYHSGFVSAAARSSQEPTFFSAASHQAFHGTGPGRFRYAVSCMGA